MNPIVVWSFLKSILPTKKIMAWILGVITAAIALFAGLNSQDLKDQFCATQEIPKLENNQK